MQIVVHSSVDVDWNTLLDLICNSAKYCNQILLLEIDMEMLEIHNFHQLAMSWASFPHKVQCRFLQIW